MIALAKWSVVSRTLNNITPTYKVPLIEKNHACSIRKEGKALFFPGYDFNSFKYHGL